MYRWGTVDITEYYNIMMPCERERGGISCEFQVDKINIIRNLNNLISILFTTYEFVSHFLTKCRSRILSQTFITNIVVYSMINLTGSAYQVTFSINFKLSIMSCTNEIDASFRFLSCNRLRLFRYIFALHTRKHKTHYWVIRSLDSFITR